MLENKDNQNNNFNSTSFSPPEQNPNNTLNTLNYNDVSSSTSQPEVLTFDEQPQHITTNQAPFSSPSPTFNPPPENPFANTSIPSHNSFQEINPNPQPLFPTSVQNITFKKSPKKKSSKVQVVAITIFAFIISSFMILTLVFNIRFLRISGTSMSPTMKSKNWVLSKKENNYTYGDIIAFYHNDVIMIKRIIALPGDTVLIDVSGNVYVNDKLIEEPYLDTKALGQPEVEFPHIVHPESYFVLGDNRPDSIDSRNIAIRDIKETDIVGKVSYSLIPPQKLN